MTDIFEGSIIRLVRRLDEFLNQVIHGYFVIAFMWGKKPISLISLVY